MNGAALTVPRPVAAGFALVALVALVVLTGCKPTDDQSAAAVPAPVSASASAPVAEPTAGLATAGEQATAGELAAAAARLGTGTLRVHSSVEGEMSLTGVVDPTAQNAELKMDMGAVDDGTQADIRKVGDDVWVRLRGPLGDLAGTGRQWLHLDAAQMTPASSLAVIPGNDPAGALALARAVTRVRRVGPYGFAGTVDLTRTPKYSPATLRALGVKAAAVPFTARTDRQGRLVQLTVDMSAIASGAGKANTWFSDFGVDVDVTRPPADETTELPEDLRSAINA
jgi:hypothetical protein